MSNQENVRLVVGYDAREAVAYHVFVQSVIEHATIPVSFHPLSARSLPFYREHHADGSNAFIYSRFLTPFLMGYRGWAIYVDGDMVCQDDIRSLWALRDDTKAVQVVKHDYQTKAPIKYLGNRNENYPRKNWSSVILWNCGHKGNSILTPDLIEKETGAFLHRFCWLDEALIGDLPIEWNWLTTEYEDNPEASLLHYTLGTPCFSAYRDAPMSSVWRHYHQLTQGGVGV
ncbi:MAG: glycosyltransferase [Methylococcaceae bacterium]|nr:glycosyltransferase [Methylococcaceae bacterium]